MKWQILRVIVLFTGIAGVAGSIGQAAPSINDASVVQINFAGSDRIGESAQGATLRDVWKLPATVEFRDRALDKFSHYILRQLTDQTVSDDSQEMRLLRPLLEDLLQKQTFLEVTDFGDDSWGCTLAVHSDENGLQTWKTNYAALRAQLGPEDDNWPRSLTFTTLKSWVIIATHTRAEDSPPDSMETNPVVQRILRDGRPGLELTNSFLSVDIDLTKLGKWWPSLIPEGPTRLTAHVRGHESNLKTEARIQFSDEIEWHTEALKIPIETIRDPNNSLMSFTAVRGISPWLKHHAVVKELRLDPVPNQLFAWGSSFAPFQIQAAFPVGNGPDQIELIADELLPRWNKNLAKNSVGNLELLSNKTGVLWKSLPALRPYLRFVQEPGQDYLLGGVFPVPPSTNPPPAALIGQLTSRENLLYYNWEITQARLVQLRSLIPLVSIVTTLPNLTADSAARTWLDEVGQKLGNTVTEISSSGPNSVSVLRTSHLGLNGLELVAFAYWLDSPNFPEASLEIGFQPVPMIEQPKP